MVETKRLIKVLIYGASVAWLVYTLTTLPSTLEAQTNGIITAIVSLINMIINDLNK
ncbi:hypothetical protein HZC30_02860 [Candidatus Woesearchaeota archaeon]|nr:hypothetical protein [Candidatus Woesearchaeota archaeon]